MPSLLGVPRAQELCSHETLDRIRRASHVFHSDPTHASFVWVALLNPCLSLEGAHVGAEDLIVYPLSGNDELVLLVDRLLGPGGCPWDQAQTHESLKRHLIEESYELLEAIDSADSAKIEEEVGDVLLQPIMHGQIAKQSSGAFDTDSSAKRAVDKLIYRHPHVFGDVEANDADQVLKNWDALKKEERPGSVLEGIPRAMPALLRAFEVSKRAARAGFEWPTIEGVWDKLTEEASELRNAQSPEEIESEIGDLLFTTVNLGRWLNVEPEEALRKMLDRFTTRFQIMEGKTARDLKDLTPSEWDSLWEQAKEVTQST